VPLVPHRGPTHAVRFALLVGVDLAALGTGAFGFAAGSVAIGSHVASDALTPTGVRPFAPLGNTRLLPGGGATNPVANYALFAPGVLATAAAPVVGGELRARAERFLSIRVRRGGMAVTCALCRRRIPVEAIDDPEAVQVHHLRPEERATSPTVELCRPCHDQVHALFTNEELREEFDTVGALREADRLTEYLEWIRGTDKLRIRTRTSNRVRDRR
jgi:hypothetical protein